MKDDRCDLLNFPKQSRRFWKDYLMITLCNQNKTHTHKYTHAHTDINPNHIEDAIVR